MAIACSTRPSSGSLIAELRQDTSIVHRPGHHWVDDSALVVLMRKLGVPASRRLAATDTMCAMSGRAGAGVNVVECSLDASARVRITALFDSAGWLDTIHISVNGNTPVAQTIAPELADRVSNPQERSLFALDADGDGRRELFTYLYAGVSRNHAYEVRRFDPKLGRFVLDSVLTGTLDLSPLDSVPCVHGSSSWGSLGLDRGEEVTCWHNGHAEVMWEEGGRAGRGYVRRWVSVRIDGKMREIRNDSISAADWERASP
jgi:hypothetical protein